MQFCWGVTGEVTASNTSGSVYRNSSTPVTFPVPFIENPYITTSAGYGDQTKYTDSWAGNVYTASGDTKSGFNAIGFSSASGATFKIYWTAIGRWQ